MTQRPRARLALMAALAAGSATVSANAAGAPREGALRETPVAVVTVSAEQIQQTGLAIDVLREINKARVDPKGYANGIRSNPPRIRGIGGRDLTEALNFLDAQAPLRPLVGSPSLTDIATIHIRDIGPRGLTSHVGSDGTTLGGRWRTRGIFSTTLAEEISYGQSTPRGVVLQLIVDPGLPTRPHRNDLFNPIFTDFGAACGKHQKYGTGCVINLSSPYMRDPPISSATPTDPPQFTCPAGQQPFENDAWRRRAFDIMLNSLTPRGSGDGVLLPELARANETTYQIFKAPSSLGLSIDAGALWKTPRLEYGYCAPPPPTPPPPP